MDQLLYTIPQCCRMAAIGRTKFYELVASGEIPVRKVGKKTLVVAADLRHWVERLPVIQTNGGERAPALRGDDTKRHDAQDRPMKG